jgi:hypothetical protein
MTTKTALASMLGSHVVLRGKVRSSGCQATPRGLQPGKPSRIGGIEMAKNPAKKPERGLRRREGAGGKQATPEEARSLAAGVLGLDGEKDETSSLAAKVARGNYENYEPTREEMQTLASSALGRE